MKELIWNPKLPLESQGEVMEYARRRYMEGATWEDLYSECKLGKSIYQRYLPVWKKEKESYDDQVLFEVRRKAIGEHCEDLARNALEIVARNLEHLNRSEEILEPRDLKVVADIATQMWKVSQVEKGAATSRVEFTSPEAAMELLRERARVFASKHGSIIDMEIDEAEEV